VLFWKPRYIASARTTQKTASIFDGTCLPLGCLEVDVLPLRAFASAGTCVPTRCLAASYNICPIVCALVGTCVPILFLELAHTVMVPL
jgi:hypothetical protein